MTPTPPTILERTRARVWSVAAVVVATAIIVVNSAGQWAVVSTVCLPGECRQPQLDSRGALDALALGLELRAYATLTVALSLLVSLLTLALALLVAWRGDRSAGLTPYAFVLLALLPASAFGPVPLINTLLSSAGVIAMFWLLATFPNSRFEPGWAAIPVLVCAAWALITSIPAIHDATGRSVEPWYTLYGLVFAVSLAAVVASQVVRFIRSGQDARRKVALLIVVVAAFTAVGAGYSVFSGADQERYGIGSLAGSLWATASSIGVLLIYSVIAVSVVNGAYGVRYAVNRVLVGAIAVAGAVLVYAIAVAAVSALASGWLPQAVGAVAAALVLAAGLRPLVRWINRLVYGSADDPVALVRALSAGLGDAQSAQGLLTVMAETIATRLRFTHVVIAPTGEESVSAGVAGAASEVSSEITAGVGVVGTISVALRAGQRRLTGRDRAALSAANGPLSAGILAVRLTTELQSSRLAMITARESERAAMRRELHDEAGPTLASISHRIEAARRGIPATDPADAHLARAAESTAEVLATVRRLSGSLRPAALDELGLVRAVEEYAAQLTPPASVRSSLAGELPDVVAVGAYRILLEALTNADRHARARVITAELANRDGWLELTVVDDGVGLVEPTAGGVGLASMRQRANELGGLLTVTRGTAGGSVVHCRLPLKATA